MEGTTSRCYALRARRWRRRIKSMPRGMASVSCIQLDDLIDAATLLSFGQANGNALHEQPSAKPVVEQAADPLDELFA